MSDQGENTKSHEALHEQYEEKDIGLILWTLEQKVDKLEKDYQYVAVELAGQLTNEISSKMNSDL